LAVTQDILVFYVLIINVGHWPKLHTDVIYHSAACNVRVTG